MEQLKHECGVAMIRLLKPLDYFEKKYGTWAYGFNKLYLMMEKQHNRGQEGAGLATVWTARWNGCLKRPKRKVLRVSTSRDTSMTT